MNQQLQDQNERKIWAERVKSRCGGGPLGIGYLTALRHLPKLLVPGILLMVPLWLVEIYVFAVPSEGAAAFVNGEFEGQAFPGTIWMAVLLAAARLIAWTLATAAAIVLVAGRVLERPVAVHAALFAVVRRLPDLLGLILIAVAMVVVIKMVWALGGFVLAQPWMVIVAVIAGMVVAIPAMLSLPAVTLEGLSPLSAVARGYELARDRPVATVFALVVGVFVVPFVVPEVITRTMILAGTMMPESLIIPVSIAGNVLVMPLEAAAFAAIFLGRLTRAYLDSLPALEHITGRLPGASR
ncbi:hypothetical protein [Nonomuraea sp. NPDC046570]|uniref:hypothetical protein n=1 Tax=Nonomuraea sp. NPDC046570 TaxID=3155255 RepID=UPI0033D4558B